MPTIWNSYSKSDTARRPRTMTRCADFVRQIASADESNVFTLDRRAAASGKRRGLAAHHLHALVERRTSAIWMDW